MTPDQEATMPEPLRLTLEGFIARLGENDAHLIFHADKPGAKVIPGFWVIDPEGEYGPYETWEAAAEDTYGAAPRDDKAELVEALTAWQVWAGKWQSSIYHELSSDCYEGLERIAGQADAALAAVGESNG